ncbi:hypothetical protein EV360DRAFT_78355 [Lentinula raphanica]|nr:hypothetical protein EV360DRAFT_78355 [Lentinula raphanica]
MQPFSLFPNELLHVVIDYVAYAPVTPELDSPFKTFFKQASPDLLALSLANWRLRLACLRFLFAHIKICNDNIEKLVDHHALLSKFTKSLLVEFDPGPSQMEDQIIYRILPQLERPLCVELNWTFDSRPSRHFFLAIRGHPTITTVLVNLLPHKSMHDGDLSKVILAQATTPAYGMSSLSLRDCLTNGMGLACLELYNLDTLDEELGIRTFPGLEELRIWMENIPLVTSWLPVFSSTHRALKKVWFLDDDQRCFAVHTPAFISSFDEETRREGLKASYTVKRIGLRRDIGHSSQEWYVMGLALSINTSLVEILMLVASSFPKLEDLSLDLGTDKGMYDIDDLSSVLARFSSLRVVHLHKVFDRLRFPSRNEKDMHQLRRIDYTSALAKFITRAESGILRYISLLAERVRSLDFFHVNELVIHEPGQGGYLVIGWLQVINSDQDVGGIPF